jgi:hypothetical protein
MRKLNNLDNGKIYKIICNTTKKVYIGSTCEIELSSRLKSHEVSYKRYMKHGGSSLSSFQILKNNNYNIELIEDYPCNFRHELCSREGELQLLYRCINKNRAGRNTVGYYQDNKEELLNNVKRYQIENKDKITQKNNTIMTCECGCSFKYVSSFMHKRSKKHKRYQDEKNLL